MVAVVSDLVDPVDVGVHSKKVGTMSASMAGGVLGLSHGMPSSWAVGVSFGGGELDVVGSGVVPWVGHEGTS